MVLIMPQPEDTLACAAVVEVSRSTFNHICGMTGRVEQDADL